MSPIGAIILLIYYYLTRVFPILLMISIFLVLIGMIIKIGLKAGQAVLIVVGTCLLFSYILYGNKAIDVLKKMYKKFATFFFYPLTNMLQKGSPEGVQAVEDNENNEEE
tara:strand:+ start:466 stop:792 length:327 start_codon:yes stop_codon:yes gene_type:complete